MPTGDALRELLASDEAYATSLLAVVVDSYGTECFSWAPQTLRSQLEDDFAVRVPDHNLDKLMAGVFVLTSDGFRQDAGQFVAVANALCGDGFRPDVFDPASAAECAWAVVETSLLEPIDGPDDFSPEVRRYVGEVLRDEGFLSPPPVLAGLADFRPRATQDFTDDPEMFAAVREAQASRSDEVRSAVERNLRELFAQLESLPLRHGGAKGLAAKAAGLLRAVSREGPA